MNQWINDMRWIPNTPHLSCSNSYIPGCNECAQNHPAISTRIWEPAYIPPSPSPITPKHLPTATTPLKYLENSFPPPLSLLLLLCLGSCQSFWIHYPLILHYHCRTFSLNANLTILLWSLKPFTRLPIALKMKFRFLNLIYKTFHNLTS